MSEYVYGADGTRQKKIASTTLCVGRTEIRNPGPSQTVLAYRHDNLRMTFKGNGAGGYSARRHIGYKDGTPAHL